jgi:hypothetical protein
MKNLDINWKIIAAISIFTAIGLTVYLVPNFSAKMYELFENIESLGV